MRFFVCTKLLQRRKALCARLVIRKQKYKFKSCISAFRYLHNKVYVQDKEQYQKMHDRLVNTKRNTL